ncbi:MAG: class I SAM-dependent RNA methyltransferase [Deltaproteobacteria bacterium]|nr:class I SAM-dependent RNA methyltransferase [Deltaproteobacteria bacterium]MCB9490198.1 class I SAM-dependent RNA methyltransferase [Deltaproteobacteria bacterium]
MAAKSALPFSVGDELTVRFETMAASGAGKGTPEGMAVGECSVFTDRAAPGDVARVRVTGIKKRFVNADLVEVIEPGPDRVAAPCPVFETCGSCHWQHLTYDAQLAQKHEVASYQLKRLIDDPSILTPVAPSPSPLGYRVRGELTAVRTGATIRLGFRRHRSHDLIQVERCPLFLPGLADRFDAIARALVDRGLAEDQPYRVRIFLDEATGRIALAAESHERASYPDVAMVVIDGDGRLVENPELDERPFSMAVDGRTIRFHPHCFTQINPAVNERLVADAVETVAPEKGLRVLELYSGIGNFSIPLAARGAKVLAVESSPVSHPWAEKNAAEHGPLPITHDGRDAFQACRGLLENDATYDVVFTDPPRVGMGPMVSEIVSLFEARRIVYVSCHPQNLVRDGLILRAHGYHPTQIRLYDMFPQTFHMESLAVFEKF